MHKKYTSAIILVIIVITTLGVLGAVYLNKQKAPSVVVKGKVTDVVSRPNQAEDGYYGITIQDDSGNSYTINATGYLNTPASPDQFGEACTDVPKVNVGDSVEFNLPKDETQASTYNICYKKHQTGYFFKQT